MRTISKIGVLLGFSVAGVSVWRWMIFYDSPFRFVIGMFVALSLMAWAYLIDWMTMKDKKDEYLHKRFDSLAQELRGKYELLETKIQSKCK
ncbi:hypothetical protein LCGC14_0509670 [marine sediment metagenome]|uniref:Uncharacterized protein n=1 Tax=marine sediment metagenome TaxID=412755 RepID=A0A0F9UNC4_9ZZZZ|nr:hypothetical protein [bacterium]